MSRIVDFSEQRNARLAEDGEASGHWSADGTLIPSERLRLRRRQGQQKRRKLWYRLKLVARLVCLMAAVALWIWLPQATFWRFDATQANAWVLKPDTLVTATAVGQFLQQLDGQSLLTLSPESLSQRYKQLYPETHQIWFRRSIWPARLYVTGVSQQPWAEVVQCGNPADADSCNRWGTITDRFKLLEANSSKPQTAASAGDLVRIVSVPGAQWLQQPETLKKLAFLSEQLKVIPQLKLRYIDVTNPVNLVAQFDDVAVQMGELDTDLTDHRIPRLLAVSDTMVRLKDQIDSVDLRWGKDVTFHKKRDASVSGAVAAQ